MPANTEKEFQTKHRLGKRVLSLLTTYSHFVVNEILKKERKKTYIMTWIRLMHALYHRCQSKQFALIRSYSS